MARRPKYRVTIFGRDWSWCGSRSMARSIPEPLQRVSQGSICGGESQGIEQFEQRSPAVFEELHLEGVCCELGKQYIETEKVGKALQDIEYEKKA